MKRTNVVFSCDLCGDAAAPVEEGQINAGWLNLSLEEEGLVRTRIEKHVCPKCFMQLARENNRQNS